MKGRDGLLAGNTVDKASRLAGVSARRFQRIMTRYLEPADDAKCGGERVFIANWRLHKNVVRQKAFDPSKAGVFGASTGLFRKLLAENEKLRNGLVLALRRKGKAALQVNRLVGRELRKMFASLCVNCGVSEEDYPLNTADKGLRALRRWMVCDFLPHYASDWTAAEGGPGAARVLTTPQPAPASQHFTEYVPYVDWQLDSARVDVRAAIEIINARGELDVVEVEGFQVLRLIELGYNSTLALFMVWGRQPNAEDVGNLLWRALNGWTQPDVLPGLQVDPGGGYAVTLIPELRWKAPRKIYLDNALAHLSTVLGTIVELTLGAEICPGTAASPLERAEIESKFALAARRLFHQLPATKGTGPKDPQRKRHEAATPAELLRSDEVEHAYHVMCGNENGSASMAAHGIPSLERLRRAVIRGAINAVSVPLASRMRHMYFPSTPIRVHADLEKGRKPYINFMRIRYSSTELQRRYDLKGNHVFARSDPDDLRVIVLFDAGGAEICRAHGEGRWGVLPHDSRMRRMAMKSIDKATFERMPQDGPLAALFARLQREAPSKPSAALQLAHCLAVLGRHMEGEEMDASLLSALIADGDGVMEATLLSGQAANDHLVSSSSEEMNSAVVESTAPTPDHQTGHTPLRAVPRNSVRLAV